MTAAPAAVPPPPPGTVTVEGESATLTFRRSFPHPPERVWDAITSPAELRAWCMTEAKIEARTGGSIDLVSGPGRLHSTGRILAWQPPKVYEYEWNVEPSRQFPNGESAVVRWELTPTSTGTLIVLTHRKLGRATAARASYGVGATLERLAAHLQGAALPDWPTALRGERPA